MRFVALGRVRQRKTALGGGLGGRKMAYLDLAHSAGEAAGFGAPTGALCIVGGHIEGLGAWLELGMGGRELTVQ
jgi:hypothetical protein